MYDNVCKFLAENYSRDFAQWLLGESIELTQLSPSELLVEPKIETLDSQRQQRNAIAATSILAGLLLEKNVIQQILREEIVKESVIYQEIVAEATAKGKAEGREEGKQEGRQEGEAAIVLRQLRRRIGEIDVNLEATIRELSVTQLENLGEALLDFTNRSDLVNWLESDQNRLG